MHDQRCRKDRFEATDNTICFDSEPCDGMRYFAEFLMVFVMNCKEKMPRPLRRGLTQTTHPFNKGMITTEIIPPLVGLADTVATPFLLGLTNIEATPPFLGQTEDTPLLL